MLHTTPHRAATAAASARAANGRYSHNPYSTAPAPSSPLSSPVDSALGDTASSPSSPRTAPASPSAMAARDDCHHATPPPLELDDWCFAQARSVPPTPKTALSTPMSSALAPCTPPAKPQLAEIPRPVNRGTPAVVHAALGDRLWYIPLPHTAHCPDFDGRLANSAVASVGMYTSPSFRAWQRARGGGNNVAPRGTADLFVAQLPFDMPLSTLQYIAAKLFLDIEILHAAPHHRRFRAYDGCAFIKLSHGDALEFERAFQKSALFDTAGVWIASTAEQRRDLARYCDWMQQKPPHERRAQLGRAVPFSAVTVEAANRSYIF